MYWVGLKTLIVRECGVIGRFWAVTLAPPIVSTILYFTIFGEIIGERVGSVAGVTYIRYMAPGLIVLWLIPYSYGHTAGGFLGARIFKYIEEVLVSPLPDWVIVTAYVLGGSIRGLLVATAVGLIALLFTDLGVRSASVIAGALVLTALVSALGGLITAILAKSFEHVATIQALVVTPLTFIGGVFAPASTLPDWARALSLADPMFYMVNAVRYGFLGISDVPVGLALASMLGLAALLFLIAMRLLNRGSGIRDLPSVGGTT